MFFESTVLLCSAPGILLSALSLLTGVYFFHTRSRGGCGGLRPPPSGYSTSTVHITKAVMVLAALSVFFLVFLGAFGDIELRRGLHSFLGKVREKREKKKNYIIIIIKINNLKKKKNYHRQFF
jgi:hypothetical protein